MAKFVELELPFRLGTTSYIWPEDLLSNVEKLAGLVNDIELVLFEINPPQAPLPSTSILGPLQQQAKEHHLTYTVHLPLDLQLAGELAEQERSLDIARQIFDWAEALSPWAYIIHLNGLDGGPASRKRAIDSLKKLSGYFADNSGARRLCIENLGSYAPAHLAPILEATPEVSCCIDIGHLWLQGQNSAGVIEWLEKWRERTRVIHIHGVAERDHKSLSLIPAKDLNETLARLVSNFRGVITLEVFNSADLFSSLETMKAALAKLCK